MGWTSLKVWTKYVSILTHLQYMLKSWDTAQQVPLLTHLIVTSNVRYVKFHWTQICQAWHIIFLNWFICGLGDSVLKTPSLPGVYGTPSILSSPRAGNMPLCTILHYNIHFEKIKYNNCIIPSSTSNSITKFYILNSLYVTHCIFFIIHKQILKMEIFICPNFISILYIRNREYNF